MRVSAVFMHWNGPFKNFTIYHSIRNLCFSLYRPYLIMGKSMLLLLVFLFNAETIIEAGDPKEALCEAVEKLKIELLVLGSHSRGTLQRAFLGSFSNYCVHNAKCQVLVVKKKA